MGKQHVFSLWVLFAAAACGGGPFAGSATAVGLVQGSTGGPLAGVTVTAAGGSTVTDASGRFELSVKKSGATVLRFESPGRAPVFQRVEPRGAETVTLSVVMLDPTLTTTIDVRGAPARVDVGEASVDFPADSIVTASGDPPAGPVDLVATVVPADQAVAASPLPLVGTDGGEEEPLISYGMIDVTLSYAGEPANLADGRSATLTFPSEPGDPSEVGLFWGDPQRGLWVREGAATSDGSSFTAEIPHLSWWNLDAFGKVPENEKACVRFVARAPDGSPIQGAVIAAVWGPNNRWSARGTTDADGTLCSECFQLAQETLVCYRAFLDSGAQRLVEDCLTITPAAQGYACGDAGCQVVDLTMSCVEDAECGPGQTCQGGACVGEDGTPAGADFVGTWNLVRIGGEPASDYGITQVVTLTTTAYTSTTSSATETCTASGTVDDWDAGTITITITETDCPEVPTGETQTVPYQVSNGGDLLTVVGENGTESEYTRSGQ